MKKLLFLSLLQVAVSCGNEGSNRDGVDQSVTTDTSLPGTIITDSSGATDMSADTTGMGRAR